jgi:hypothetical protein
MLRPLKLGGRGTSSYAYAAKIYHDLNDSLILQQRIQITIKTRNVDMSKHLEI